jgi:DNA-binding Xre family transcriptional regulator
MKKLILKNKIIVLSLLLTASPIAVFASKEPTLSEKYPMLLSRSCMQSYTSEVGGILKMVNRAKADKFLQDIKTSRVAQDQSIDNIFNKIESKISDDNKKEVVEDHKTEVVKIISEKRLKLDELKDSLQVSNSDIENIVQSTIDEQVASSTNPKICIFTTKNSKDIRASNIQKLKDLVTNKKDAYQKESQEIQKSFIDDIQNSLTSLSKDLSAK